VISKIAELTLIAKPNTRDSIFGITMHNVCSDV